MNIKTKKTLTNIALLLVIILACCVFSYHLKKQMPSGVDATNYIPAIQWIEKTGNVPDTYEPIQLGFSAYTSPLPSLDLAILHQFSETNITYPFFSIFQIIVLIFLCLTTYLVGSIYHKVTGIFSVLFLIISEGIAFLFTSSTIANLLALSLINILFYIIYQFQKTKNKKNIILFFIFLTALFFTHRQLTFPLFLVVFPIYCLVIFTKSKDKVKYYLEKIVYFIKQNKILSIIFTTIFLAILCLITYKLAIYLNSIISEWIKAYVINDRENPFGKLIKVSDWFKYFGPIYALFSLLGIAIIVKKIKLNKKYNFYFFPIIWTGFALLLSLINNFGISFEAQRWLYQSYIFLAMFSGIAVFEILQSLKNKKTLIPILLFLIISIITLQGFQINKFYSDTSNFVKKEDIEAFRFAYEKTKYGETILINKNPLNCGYDKLLVNLERIFDYSLGEKVGVKNEGSLKKYLIENNIKIIIVHTEKNKFNSELKNMNSLKKIYGNNGNAVYELSL